MEQDGKEGPYKLYFNDYTDGGKVGKPNTLEVDIIVGADGANSRVAREIDAGEYDYAIAFQERIRIPDDKMDYYKVGCGVHMVCNRFVQGYCFVPKCFVPANV